MNRSGPAETDVLVIGGGVAGQQAALAAERGGASVIMVSKVPFLESHSAEAEAGINAVMPPVDDWEEHARDTLNFSAFLADHDAIETLCRDAASVMAELIELGVPIRKELIGTGAKSYYLPDINGKTMMLALNKATSCNSGILQVEAEALSLVIDEGQACFGALLLPLYRAEARAGHPIVISASSTIIATGGCGQLFSPTTNGPQCTGDGMVLAARAGAELADMEMLQFHPTTLVGSGKLISEGVRGAGALLRNSKGERFMARYAPTLLELAPRDVVARAIAAEIQEGRGTPEGAVLLDLSDLPESIIREELPHVMTIAKSYADIDIIRQRAIPVAPGMHYCMGGIRTTIDGETSIAGMYAAGETACVSVHGANRMGGNSLLDAAVFGRRAGQAAGRHAVDIRGRRIRSAGTRDSLGAAVRRKELSQPADHDENYGQSHGLVDRLHSVMREGLGLIRTERGIQQAIAAISDLRAEQSTSADASRSGLQRSCLLDLATVVAASALERRESRGAHFRSDYAQTDSTPRHTIAKIGSDGKVQVTFEPVRATRWTIGNRIL